MKKMLYWLIPMVLLFCGALQAQCVQKKVAETIAFPLICLDTLGRNATPDSVHLTTYKDNATYATYFTRSTTFPFSDISIDTTKPALGGTLPVTYWFVDQIQDIDGTASNSQLSINIDMWWKGYSTPNRFCVQIITDSLNASLSRIIAYLDETISGSIDSVRDVVGDSTTSWKHITKGFADSTRDVVGDTFNVVSGGVFLAAAANKSVADSIRDVVGDSTTAWKFNDPDSGATARISKRMWGVQLGAAGSSDSLTKAQRLSALPAATPDSVRDVIGDSTTAWKYGRVMPDSVRDIFGDSLTAMKYYVKGLADSTRDVVGDTFNVVSGGVFLSAAGNKSVADSVRDVIGDSLTAFMFEVIDSLRGNTWSATAAGSGVDSAVVSRIMRRMWGIQLGATGSTDSLTKAQRLAALPAATPDSVRDILGDSLATFGSISSIPDSVRDVFGDSTTSWKYYTKGLADSMRDVVGDTFNVTSGVVAANAMQISGDATAADNFETMLDGTGTATLTLEGLTIAASTGVGVAISGASGEYGMTVTGGTNGGGALFSSGATTGYGMVLTGSTAALSGQLTSSNFAAGAITANAIADLAIDSNTFALDARKMIAIRADSGAAGGTGLDSATTSRIMRRITWGLGGTGSNTDSTTLAERTATASGTVTADIYPFNGIKLTIDAAGTDPDAQFVVDTASLGGLSSHQATLVNRQLVVRSLSGIEVQIPTTINRVAYTGANCSLSVNMNMPINFAAGDTIQLAGWPWHDFATVSEASDSNALALLSADTTGLGGDATVGGAIVAEGSDTTKQKVMLTNMGLPRGLDSLASLSETATADGTLRRGEIVTARAAAETTMVILDRDSVLARGGIIDSVTYTDTLGSQVESSGSSGGGCPDSVGNAWTISAYDSVNSVAVTNATITLKASAGATLPLAQSSHAPFTFTAVDGTYYVTVEANGITFPPRSITISGATSTTMNGGGFTVMAPSSPDVCRVYGRLTATNGEVLVGASIEFELTNYDDSLLYISGAELIVPVISFATSNALGEWYVDLVPNSLFDAKSRYVMRVNHSGAQFQPRLLKAVPDTATINVGELY